jgi:hypothetical protein
MWVAKPQASRAVPAHPQIRVFYAVCHNHTAVGQKVFVTVINKMSVGRTRLLISQQLLGSESPFVISGYHWGLNNIFAFWGDITERRLVVTYRRFCTEWLS